MKSISCLCSSWISLLMAFCMPVHFFESLVSSLIWSDPYLLLTFLIDFDLFQITPISSIFSSRCVLGVFLMELLKCESDWLKTERCVLPPPSSCLEPDSNETMLLTIELCCWMFKMPWWFFIGLCLLKKCASSICSLLAYCLRLYQWFDKVIWDLWLPKWYWFDERLELGGFEWVSGSPSFSSGMLNRILPNLGAAPVCAISFDVPDKWLVSFVFMMCILWTSPSVYLEFTWCLPSYSMEF